MELSGLSVLDLYAGSGALGLEALSRGAATAIFVEADPRTVNVLERNISAVGLPGATLRRGAVTAVLSADAAVPADLVLADPPYDVAATEVKIVLTLLATHGWVRPGSVAVVECSAMGAPLTWPPGWRCWEPRRYGDTRLELAELED